MREIVANFNFSSFFKSIELIDTLISIDNDNNNIDNR